VFFADKDTVTPQFEHGFLMGYCSGFCVKRVSKAVVYVVGAFFVTVQILAYYGYVKIDMEKVNKDVNSKLGLKKDGKVDMKDAEFAYEKVRNNICSSCC
jgi:uncharacterized membrane protein (Fun14 family)